MSYELLSECCGAPPRHSVEDGLGICSKCGEWAGFYDEDEEENDE